MSRMSNEFLNTADDRASADADEVAWLRAEVARLEGVVARAATLLDEGDPAGLLVRLGHKLDRTGWPDTADDVTRTAATIAEARALLVGACP